MLPTPIENIDKVLSYWEFFLLEIIKKLSPGISVDGTDSEAHTPMAISVPDSDFHDFDLNQTKSSFGDNQVWSAYENDDGMPRF